MEIRIVSVGMPHPVVPVRMVVWFAWRVVRRMLMLVMLIVDMHMLVLHRLMDVHVLVHLD